MPDQYHFCEQAPPLTKRGEEGLRLLQHAWNEYDVAKYHGHWYSMTSYALTLFYLVLGAFIVLFIVILTSSCGDDISASNGANCIFVDISQTHLERAIFCLTLLVTLVVSLDECIKPAQKAMHLKPAAEKLKSWIWLYR